MPEISLTRVGGATVVLRLGPITVLVDPAFTAAGQRVYQGWGRWARRPVGPSLDVAGMSDIDVVLVTQLHADHWDRVAATGLTRTLRLIGSPHVAARLRHGRRGFTKAQAVRRKPVVTYRGFWGLRVSAVPASRPGGLWRWLLSPPSGYVLELLGEDEQPVAAAYVSGDTQGVPPSVVERIRSVAPELDLAVLSVGGRPLSGGVTTAMAPHAAAALVTSLRPRAVAIVHTEFDETLADRAAESAEAQGIRVVPISPGVPHRV